MTGNPYDRLLRPSQREAIRDKFAALLLAPNIPESLRSYARAGVALALSHEALEDIAAAIPEAEPRRTRSKGT